MIVDAAFLGVSKASTNKHIKGVEIWGQLISREEGVGFLHLLEVVNMLSIPKVGEGFLY